MSIEIPCANWPLITSAPVRVVQFVLGDEERGEPYLLFEDAPKIIGHDEIIKVTLKKLELIIRLKTQMI